MVSIALSGARIVLFSIVFATAILRFRLVGVSAMRLFLILMLAPLAAVAIDLTDQQRADIEARIQPFSAVCVQGETCSGGSDAVVASAGVKL